MTFERKLYLNSLQKVLLKVREVPRRYTHFAVRSTVSDLLDYQTRGQSNLTKSASRGAHSPVRGHPRGSKVVALNSWGRVSY